ncbi:hypothetical protein DSCA_60060 [Desulfosarcina alkanivorans]|uniref:Uncharacterized protein n=1 Tax=Desulfosarcina alkanivorans TaxID=571177 RepID=A0A5K7YS10_9BACT|nr:hypothetical protein [Desulfosarcina alkanivorans]BBO72076.1 hypothetical protein DSCA_60060 [Desulfosarcina alkanivorans]
MVYYDRVKTEEEIARAVETTTRNLDHLLRSRDNIERQEDMVLAERGRLVENRAKVGTLTEEEIIIGRICGTLEDLPEETLPSLRKLDSDIADCDRALAYLQKQKQPILEEIPKAAAEKENWQGDLEYVVARRQFIKRVACGTVTTEARNRFKAAAGAVGKEHAAYEILSEIA